MVVFLAAGFLADAFAAAGFLAGALAAAGFAVVFFAVVAVILTPASLAILCRPLLRRAAVFFLIKPFLTAVSSSRCAAAKVSAVGLTINALVADLISFLIPMFRSRRLMVCFARLMADLMIGMILLYLYRFVSLIR